MSKAGMKKKTPHPFDSDSDSEPNSKPTRKQAFDDMSVQQLEKYAVNKAEETTDAVNSCVRIAETIKEDAARTLVTLHEQGEQINRTHETCTKIDQDLSKGESLLSSLGGIFSKPWKAKKTRQIKGPAITRDDSFKKKKSHMEQREKLGLSSSPRKNRQYAESASTMDKVQVEKAKQDDSLEDLSGILGQLKGMAVDMGSELDRQNKAMDALNEDVDELNSRMKGANRRARNILGK